jgi:hypothetical protein
LEGNEFPALIVSSVKAESPIVDAPVALGTWFRVRALELLISPPPAKVNQPEVPQKDSTFELESMYGCP